MSPRTQYGLVTSPLTQFAHSSSMVKISHEFRDVKSTNQMSRADHECISVIEDNLLRTLIGLEELTIEDSLRALTQTIGLHDQLYNY